MPRKILFLLTVWLTMTGLRSEDRTTRPLSLEECVQLALKNNLDVQIERYAPEIAGYNLSAAYGSYEPVFNFAASDSYVKQPAQLDPKKNGLDLPYEETTDRFGSGITGLLPIGLSYALSGNLNYFNADTYTNYPAVPAGIRQTNEYVGGVAITLQQPLLRDFWIDSSRLKVGVNKKNVKISELSLRQEIMNVITKVELAYYELIFARGIVDVQDKAVALAKQLLAENRKRVQVGDLPPLDEKQAESQVETAEANLLSARLALLRQQDALKILLSDDFRSWSRIDIEPTDGLVAPVVVVDKMECWQNAVTLRPDLLEFRLVLQRQDLVIRYEYNQLFPSLNLVGGYGLGGVQSSVDGVLDQIGSRSNPAYSYGVVVSIPLGGNRTARNNYKSARAAKQQSLLQYKKLEQDVLTQVDIAADTIQTQFKRVRSTRQARVYAEAALEAEIKKLQNGQSTSFVVLQLQQNLTDARSAEIRALADYNEALAQLAFAEGTTLEKNHVNLSAK